VYREQFPNARDALPAMMEHVVGAIRARFPGVAPQLIMVVIPGKLYTERDRHTDRERERERERENRERDRHTERERESPPVGRR
jgi:hypothetical protein